MGTLMPRVTMFDDHEAPTWEVVRDHLLSMQDEKGVTLAVDDETCLIVYYFSGLGYFVSGQAVGDRDYSNLIERSLGDEPVSAFLGGNTNECPRHAFVPSSTLLKAVETYYRTGQRDPDCEWVLAQDAIYD
jgi:immunity protein Imm1 of predicted polymorphic toxin system